MNDAGYTLTEMLVAMAIIAMAVTGLTEGARVIGAHQARVALGLEQVRRFSDAQQALSGLFEGRGPFFSSDPSALDGDDRDLTFDCGGVQCGAHLGADDRGAFLSIFEGRDKQTVRLGRLHGPHFLYVGSRSQLDAWPPSGPEVETLRSVSLLVPGKDGDIPAATARLWRQQPLDCVYDVISQTCRAAGL